MIKIIALILIASSISHAGTYSFRYNEPGELKITLEAENYNAALYKAAKMCFNILTKGVYPGEEAGLNIIDICANPIYNNKVKEAR